MKITAILENTTKRTNMQIEHGLSLYIETDKHNILFDMGQSDLFADNAKKLNINLSYVDIAILSHGHYDHGGGLSRFLELNTTAPIYISQFAFEPHYNGNQKYIGLDKSLYQNKRFIFTNEKLEIGAELKLFSCNQKERIYNTSGSGLNMLQNDILLPDDFRHEQYLMIEENDKKVLISGCSHKGILNLVSWFKPNYLIGGFHISKLETEADLTNIAKSLNKYQTKYYTCHCTGVKQYNYIKKYMSNINYLSCGQTISI